MVCRIIIIFKSLSRSLLECYDKVLQYTCTPPPPRKVIRKRINFLLRPQKCHIHKREVRRMNKASCMAWRNKYVRVRVWRKWDWYRSVLERNWHKNVVKEFNIIIILRKRSCILNDITKLDSGKIGCAEGYWTKLASWAIRVTRTWRIRITEFQGVLQESPGLGD